VYTAPVAVYCSLSGRYVGIAFDSVPAGAWGKLSLAEVEGYGVSDQPEVETSKIERFGPMTNDGSIEESPFYSNTDYLLCYVYEDAAWYFILSGKQIDG